MKKLNLIIALVSITFANAQTTWVFDQSHSSVRFSVDHMVISQVEGQFTSYDGNVKTTKDDFSDAEINLNIDLNSINTADEKRDGHLKSADFFDTANYPNMKFVSTSVTTTANGKYNLKGNLTLHGVTQEVTLAMSYGGTVKDPWGNTKAGLKVTGKINRTDFGLKYNAAMETGGLLIGEEVEITCKVELIKI